MSKFKIKLDGGTPDAGEESLDLGKEQVADGLSSAELNPSSMAEVASVAAPAATSATVKAEDTPVKSLMSIEADALPIPPEPDTQMGSQGLVQRRAPLNPLASPKLGKYRLGTSKKKAVDPRLKNNPVTGRLVVMIGTTCALIFVFIQELIVNYLSFNGRCISPVRLFENDQGTPMSRPIKIFELLSYEPCETITGTSYKDRAALGSNAGDFGWPSFIQSGPTRKKIGGAWDSPNKRIYRQMGGLDTNMIRNFGEIFRLFWSMWMHGGIMHILVNVACQVQILWMIEPDWGFWRTLMTFWVSGITGNLLSGVLDPCNVTVGSSGALYGILASLIPYCIEYWKTIPRPCCILLFMVVVLIIGILTGFTGYTDNFAHMGGALGGLLFAFGTIASLEALDDCTLGERMATTPPFRFCIPKSTRESILAAKAEREKKERIAKKKKKATGARGKAIRAVKGATGGAGKPVCRMGKREWIVRITCCVLLLITWVVLFCYLLKESLYTKMDPWGQYKFQGRMDCNCCKIGGTAYADYKKGALGNWHCFPEPKTSSLFTDYCEP